MAGSTSAGTVRIIRGVLVGVGVTWATLRPQARAGSANNTGNPQVINRFIKKTSHSLSTGAAVQLSCMLLPGAL
jgi:hypothetical protein